MAAKTATNKKTENAVQETPVSMTMELEPKAPRPFRYSVYQTQFNSDDVRDNLNRMLDEKIEEIEVHNYGGIVLLIGKRYFADNELPYVAEAETTT